MSDAAALAAPPKPDQRSRIVDAATRLMAEGGLAGMSMRALASACDLNVATLYHYFPSKQALFDAVIGERRFTEQMDEVPAIDRAAPLDERVQALVAWVLHAASDHEDVWRLLLGESLRGTPQATSAAHALTVAFEEMLAGWLAELVPDLVADRRAVAGLVRAAVYGFLVETLLTPADDRAALLDARAADVARALVPPAG